MLDGGGGRSGGGGGGVQEKPQTGTVGGREPAETLLEWDDPKFDFRHTHTHTETHLSVSRCFSLSPFFTLNCVPQDELKWNSSQ